MKIAVDAMGGDFAPAEIVKGALIASRDSGAGLILCGQKDRIEAELAKHDTSGIDLEVLHTDEYLLEGEQPAYALRTKRKASIAVAVGQVKECRAAAAYSAGPTGGVITSALMILGMVEGISKPVLGGPFVGFAPGTVIMDVGGSIDIRPDQLLDFGIVGVVYARKLLDIPNPSVAILSVGSEEGKGNELVKNAYPLFKMSGLNFIGNIEGYDIPTGKANVVVCDGFVGNILVKFYECLGRVEANWLSKKLKDKLPENEIQEICSGLVKLTNAADIAGGGPIWAVNGMVIKGHGRSKFPEVSSGVLQAKALVEKDVVGALKAELASIRARL